jgi:hypothetical protein
MPTQLKERRPGTPRPTGFIPLKSDLQGHVPSLMCSRFHCSRLNAYLNPKPTASMALACVLFASFSCGGGGALGGMSTGSAGIAADRQFDGDTGTGAYKDHPDGGWKGLPLSGASGDLSMAVGFDKNGVYVAETDSTLNGTFFAIPNADVAWSGSGTISLSHEGIASGQAFAIPAIDLDPNKAATSAEYFVAHSVPLPNGTNVALSLEIASVNWSGLPSTPVAAFSSTVAVATGFLYNTPKAAPQPSPPDISGTESRRVFSAYSVAMGTSTQSWVPDLAVPIAVLRGPIRTTYFSSST